MARWADVKDLVRRTHTLDVDEDDEFAVTLERRDGDAVRAQRIMVSRYQAFGQTMIEYRSAFGDVDEYDLKELLVESLRLPIGSVALHGRYLVLVQKDCLDDITEEAAVRMLTRVSLLADVLEGRTGGDKF
ncbi:MAG: hypothetical protein ACI9MC_000861 [Kiritimatiellia bacterium]